MLGSDAMIMCRLMKQANLTGEESQKFFEFLEKKGWVLETADDGELVAIKDGKYMTESEWAIEHRECFTGFK